MKKREKAEDKREKAEDKREQAEDKREQAVNVASERWMLGIPITQRRMPDGFLAVCIAWSGK